MPSRAALRAATAAGRRASLRPTRRRKQVNTKPTLWEYGEFVAVDGEGFSDGEPFDFRIGKDATQYKGRYHAYAYLSASDGSALYNDRGRLAIDQCLAFLCGIVERNPKAIVVAFGASYDVTHMVGLDLEPEQIKALIKGGAGKPCIYDNGQYQYVLDYRPRKCLTVQRWPSGARRWTVNSKGRKVATPHLTVRLWDVWGFFQSSFAEVMKKWLPGDPDLDFIVKMKGERSIFTREEMPEIRRYNEAELRILVKIMNRVRDAINDLGLKITRWDGAGAIAKAMMAKHQVKDHKADLPTEVFEAARRAYSGGHIEAYKLGHYQGKVYHYDQNSAYPHQFRTLPTLANGKWISGTDNDPPSGYTIVNIRWSYPEGLSFYPLFYRQDNGSIIYPSRGSGWYWHSEYVVARRYFERCKNEGPIIQNISFRVVNWHHFQAANDDKPFGWVADYYIERQRYIEVAELKDYVSGPEKIIKLGLNALYGATAQQVGARIDAEGKLRIPPYFQLDWAGYVTAGCRAAMMEAAIQKPHAIIMIATDGIFSTEPLNLNCPKKKILGEWEAKVHDGITVVMPGVYWTHDKGEMQNFSRGFDKRKMRDAEFVVQAWRDASRPATRSSGRSAGWSTPIRLTRMIGLGTACASKEFWKIRGCYAESERHLCLDGDNSKRYPIQIGPKCRPDLGLIDTKPRDHDILNIIGLDIPESAPYPVAWIDGVVARDLVEGEMADELEAMDAANA